MITHFACGDTEDLFNGKRVKMEQWQRQSC